MKRAEFDAMTAQLSPALTRAGELIRAVYTCKADDDVLGEVLDIIKAAGFTLAAHAENSTWYERLEKDLLDNWDQARQLVFGVYAGKQSDANLRRALDHLAAADRTLGMAAHNATWDRER